MFGTDSQKVHSDRVSFLNVFYSIFPLYVSLGHEDGLETRIGGKCCKTYFSTCLPAFMDLLSQFKGPPCCLDTFFFQMLKRISRIFALRIFFFPTPEPTFQESSVARIFVSSLSALRHGCQLCLWPAGSQWGEGGGGPKYLLHFCTQQEPGSSYIASSQRACLGLSVIGSSPFA